MNHGEQLLRGSGIAPQLSPQWKPYEWCGVKGWDPAKAAAPLTAVQEREAREAKFARLRDRGVSIQDAGRLVGIGEDTARLYDQRRRAAGP